MVPWVHDYVDGKPQTTAPRDPKDAISICKRSASEIRSREIGMALVTDPVRMNPV